jgi:uncharacterized membrane protein
VAEDDEQRPRHADPDLGRLLALSDGVFAIAMTLLVLDVPVPHLVARSDDLLLRALGSLASNLLAFALSFWLVAMYWVQHRRLLRDVVRTSSALLWLNLLLLLLVCLVPFTAGVLSHYGDLATAAIVYAANLGALSVVTLGLQAACWQGHLLSPRPRPEQYRLSLLGPLAGVAIFGVSMLIALRSPAYAEYSWVALVVVRLGRGGRWASGRLIGLVRRARRQRSVESVPGGR